jgi:nucleotide-binding universal stress UspA family protein
MYYKKLFYNFTASLINQTKMGKVNKMLIAVDNSQCSMDAAKEGINLAHQLDAEVGFIFVIDISRIMTDPEVGILIQESIKMLKEEAETTLEKLAALYNKEKITKFTPEGFPYEEIIRTATEFNADLIVIGTHGRTGLKHLLMGSVAENVLRHAKIPLLVVSNKK